jgi:hypothetical protein
MSGQSAEKPANSHKQTSGLSKMRCMRTKMGIPSPRERGEGTTRLRIAPCLRLSSGQGRNLSSKTMHRINVENGKTPLHIFEVSTWLRIQIQRWSCQIIDGKLSRSDLAARLGKTCMNQNNQSLKWKAEKNVPGQSERSGAIGNEPRGKRVRI